MKILVIGGKRFVGRAIVEQGLACGHEITLFNRGKSNTGLFPDVEHLVGDRDGGLDVLKNRKWDAVVDSCGYYPRLVRESARVLKEAVKHYVFISTISVFADYNTPNADEDYKLGTISDETVEEIRRDTYGPLKVLCEKAVCEEMGSRVTIIRPGVVVGPNDTSDRLTYWVRRVADGGEVLVPGAPDSPLQFIDVRDLAAWVLSAVVKKLYGTFIATGPAYELSMQSLLETCRAVSGSDASFTYVGDEFLDEQGLVANSDKPWWVPESEVGFCRMNNAKAVGVGLSFRPLEETVRDILDWESARSSAYNWVSGLRAAREKELLQIWHGR